MLFQVIRKTPFVKSKEENKNIYSSFGVVKELGVDWNLFNIKELLTTLKKVEGISDLKRINLQKDVKKGTLKVVCYQNFRFESLTETPRILTKRGKTDRNLRLEEMKLNNCIPEKKKPSLKHLLDNNLVLNGWRIQHYHGTKIFCALHLTYKSLVKKKMKSENVIVWNLIMVPTFNFF